MKIGKHIYLDDYPLLLNGIYLSHNATKKRKFSQIIKETDLLPYPASKTYYAKMW
jgi:hypothetical protein